MNKDRVQTSRFYIRADTLRAKLRNNLNSLFKKILSARLWIFNDWGVTTMTREIAEEVFDLLDRRKYSSAMILTSNRSRLDGTWQVWKRSFLSNTFFNQS